MNFYVKNLIMGKNHRIVVHPNSFTNINNGIIKLFPIAVIHQIHYHKDEFHQQQKRKIDRSHQLDLLEVSKSESFSLINIV
jgi:hypothetical protein